MSTTVESAERVFETPLGNVTLYVRDAQPLVDLDVSGTTVEVDELLAIVGALEDAARELTSLGVARMTAGLDECPPWCTAATDADLIGRDFHEWCGAIPRGDGVVARRAHRGARGHYVVEQWEFVEADGRRWFSRMDRIHAVRKEVASR